MQIQSNLWAPPLPWPLMSARPAAQISLISRILWIGQRDGWNGVKKRWQRLNGLPDTTQQRAASVWNGNEAVLVGCVIRN